jgi:hypothetical protein
LINPMQFARKLIDGLKHSKIDVQNPHPFY